MPLSVPAFTIDDFNAAVGTITDVYPKTTLHANINMARSSLDYVDSADTILGTEVTLTEFLLTDFPGAHMVEVEGFIDLSPMGAADTITINEYGTIEPGVYVLYDSYTFSGVQSKPLIHFSKKNPYTNWKITITQTAGAVKTIYAYVSYKLFFPVTLP